MALAAPPVDILPDVAVPVAEHLLGRWAGGRLVAAPVAAVLERSLREVHRSVSALVRRPLPIDRWLATALGGAPQGLPGDALGRWAADRLIQLLDAVGPASAMSAVAGLPGTPGRPPGLGPVPSLPGYTPPARWDERSVLRALLSLGRIGAQEVATLPARMAVATAMSGTAVALPGVRSTAWVGTRVHSELQQRYRASYATGNLVVTDRAVWRQLPPPAYSGLPLSEAAVTGPPALAAMYLAWLSASWTSTRRADVTDLDRAANWEIKPLLQAPAGVLQEAWYRCAYNWTAENLQASNPAWTGLFPWLRTGPTWEPSLLRSISVPPQGGQPAVAVPFSTAALPAMVLYAVVSGPTMVDLAVLVALMLQLIEREVKRRLEQAVAAARALLEALAGVLGEVAAWISEHLVALVVVVAVAGLAVALIVSAPAWAPAVGAGLLTAAGARLILGPITQPDPGAPPGSELSMTSVDFGPLSVRMPPSFVPRFTAGLEVVAGDALGALARAGGSPGSV
ncbi:hypothetical protein DQ237_00445 [Blastococcus sp. TF02-8]|uniref:hypothetical protein n=1 Tax=Blastococcus sp. TF02-8 TaxID=2250574 RepID=UPI000DE862D4|nr:hypothetical protein [Blastococcus sp. TF02-8]RBY97468.1 hypothetical protein DQ237_00445 [Blastococcus sp. TF02-8]